MHDTPPEIERLRAAAHRRPDDLVPVEEAEDAVWDVITRMNEEPAPCSGGAKRQARWLWEQSERPRVWADANGDHPILVPFPMAEQAVHVARASVVREVVADLRAESEITGVARLAADQLADYLEQRYGRPTDPDVADERPISPRSVLVAHPREGDVRFDAYPGRDLIGDVARFAAGGLGITVGSDHATLAVGGVILDADEPLPDMPRFDLVLIGGVV